MGGSAEAAEAKLPKNAPKKPDGKVTVPPKSDKDNKEEAKAKPVTQVKTAELTPNKVQQGDEKKSETRTDSKEVSKTGNTIPSITKETVSLQMKTAPVNAPSPAKQPTPVVDPVKLLAQYEAKAKEAAKKIQLRSFIKKHLLAGSHKMDYELDQLHAILDMAQYAFLKASPLLEINAPVNICGDIHGQYGDLFRIFNSCGLPFRKKYLFLGDYVDRGRHSFEVIILLLALRIEFPRRVFLLRGNHELANINKVYGFMGDCRSRYRSGMDWKVLYEHFNEVFAVMPLAAIVNNKILCMHGGLSPDLNSLDDIRKLARPITVVNKGLAQDLLWADPETGVSGFQLNKVRAVSHVFGEEAVAAKCKQLKIDLIVRAHQVVEYGYAFFANRSLITVFSAARYNEDLWNFAAVVRVDEKLEVSFVQLKPAEWESYHQDRNQAAADTANVDDEEGK